MQYRVVCILILVSACTQSYAQEAIPVNIFESWGYSTLEDSAHHQRSRQYDLHTHLSDFTFSFTLQDEQHPALTPYRYFQQQFAITPSPTSGNSEVSLHYWHLQSTTPLPSHEDFWFSSGVGFTYFAANNSQFEDELKLSASIGMHRRLWHDQQVQLLLESRLYGTYMGSDDSLFCQGQHCAIAVNNELWVQAELSLQLSVSF